MERLRPAFCFTFLPGFSTVPFALFVMALVFQVLKHDGVGGIRHLAADLVCGVVPAPGLPALEFAQFAAGPAAAVGALLLPGHPALVPLDPGVLDGRVGEGMDFARAVRGLSHVAVDAHGPVCRGRAHVGVVDRHLEHDVGVPLRLPAFGLLPYAHGQRLAVGIPVDGTEAHPAHLRDVQPSFLDAHVGRDGEGRLGVVPGLVPGTPVSGRSGSKNAA